MFPFPPDPIPGDTRFRDQCIHGLLISILIGMAWFALKRRSPDAKDTFSVWFLLWYGVVCIVFIGLQHRNAWTDAICVYAGLASMICFRGAIWNWLPSFNETERKRAISRSDSAVVFVIISIVTALLAPNVTSAPSPGFRMQCRNTLKQLIIGMHNYHDDFKRFPSAAGGVASAGAEFQPAVSWRITLLPYLESKALYDRYDLTAAWDSAANAPLMAEKVDFYRCPSHARAVNIPADAPQLTSYVLPTGPGTVFGDPARPAMNFKEISDGTSNTLLILEACGTNIIWSEPRDIDVLNTPFGVNLPGPSKGLSSGTISGYHVAGAHVAFADGSVRFVPSTTSPAILKSAISASGNEETGAKDL